MDFANYKNVGIWSDNLWTHLKNTNNLGKSLSSVVKKQIKNETNKMKKKKKIHVLKNNETNKKNIFNDQIIS